MIQRLICFVLLFVKTLVPAKALDHFIYAANINGEFFRHIHFLQKWQSPTFGLYLMLCRQAKMR